MRLVLERQGEVVRGAERGTSVGWSPQPYGDARDVQFRAEMPRPHRGIMVSRRKGCSVPGTGGFAMSPRMAIFVNDRISLPDDEVSEQFVRSPGPGGQNVNKLATAVQLRFDARGSKSLPEDVRARLLDLAGTRATKHGEIVIDAHRFRTRERNREDALERLLSLVRRAAVAAKPRKATRPSRASKQRRMEDKRRRSRLKLARQRLDPDIEA